MSLKLELVVTAKNGVFVKEAKSDPYPYSRSNLPELFFDGEHPAKSFTENWFRIKNIPEKIELVKKQPDINHRYELVDKSMASDKIPLVFNREDVAIYEDYSWNFKYEYQHLRSLYTPVSDPQPDIMETIEFEITARVDIDQVENYKGFEYPVYKGHWVSDGTTTITEKNAQHQLLDRLVFPSLVLPDRPCKLTSRQTFDIIRKHVSDNINRKWAKITSDYAFCFTVKKIIPLPKPIEYTIDKSWGTRRKPKYEKRYQNSRDVEIFEMTHSESKYNGYTVIEPFVGENQEDLGNNISDYLSTLMDYINEPLEECEHCKGRGVIIKEMEKK